MNSPIHTMCPTCGKTKSTAITVNAANMYPNPYFYQSVIPPYGARDTTVTSGSGMIPLTFTTTNGTAAQSTGSWMLTSPSSPICTCPPEPIVPKDGDTLANAAVHALAQNGGGMQTWSGGKDHALKYILVAVPRTEKWHTLGEEIITRVSEQCEVCGFFNEVRHHAGQEQLPQYPMVEE